MKRSRLTADAVRALRRFKLRTAFIMLGGFVGAAALTLILSAGDAAERKVLATVRQLAPVSATVQLGPEWIF